MTPQELRKEYAGTDADGDLCHTIHVNTVAQLLKERDQQIKQLKHSNEKLREIANSMKDANAELFGLNLALEGRLERARKEAADLAMSIYNNEYKNKPKSVPIELCDTIEGIITQIDNMYTGVKMDRDHLKEQLAILQRWLSTGIFYRLDELAKHDAEVIEDALNDLSTAIRYEFTGVYSLDGIEEFVDNYINQLHQKAREVG